MGEQFSIVEMLVQNTPEESPFLIQSVHKGILL